MTFVCRTVFVKSSALLPHAFDIHKAVASDRQGRRPVAQVLRLQFTAASNVL